MLKEVEFKKLKGLNQLTLTFGDKRVMGIFGPNGCGKSTILHTLACLYQPYFKSKERKQADGSKKSEKVFINYLGQIYKTFNNFFVSVEDNNWDDSEISYTLWVENPIPQKSEIKKTIKKKPSRWNIEYPKRVQRDVFLLSISDNVPDIETETRANVAFAGTVRKQQVESIQSLASLIMQCRYSDYEVKKKKTKGGSDPKSYITCKRNGIECTSLSLGAGEQKLFRLLEILVNAPEYSLILIDEIELTLHGAALDRMINEMVKIADRKELQIVFTSHSLKLAKRKDIEIRYILPRDGAQTQCYNVVSPECERLMSGEVENGLLIFVEDTVAQAIVKKIAKEEKITKDVTVIPVGDVMNVYRAVAGMVVSKTMDPERVVGVIDGDRDVAEKEKESHAEKLVSGNDANSIETRRILPTLMKGFHPDAKKAPEEMMYDMLLNCGIDDELIDVAKTLNYVADHHDYVTELMKKTGQTEDVVLVEIMNIISKHPNWSNYTEEVRNCIRERKAALTLGAFPDKE